MAESMRMTRRQSVKVITGISVFAASQIAFQKAEGSCWSPEEIFIDRTCPANPIFLRAAGWG
jgi:hypothetical protein